MNSEFLKNFGIDLATRVVSFGGSSVLTAKAATWLGFSVVSISSVPALAFGAGVGLISSVASPLLAKIKVFQNPWANLAASTTLGAGATFGLFYGASALGIVAAPVTVPTALVLTIVGVASTILAFIVKGLICKCASSNESKKEGPQNNNAPENNTENKSKASVEDKKEKKCEGEAEKKSGTESTGTSSSSSRTIRSAEKKPSVEPADDTDSSDEDEIEAEVKTRQ